MLNVLNPATGESIAEVPVATADTVDRAVATARGAFGTWSNTTPAERQEALLKLADAVEAHADELAELESRNVGKPLAAVKADEMPAGVDNLRFFAGAARCLEGKAAGEYLEGYTSMIRREPVGVVGQIAPWNYPLLMAIWKIGPALAAGNTIVLKPAETTPMTTLRLGELANEILPEGVLNVVTGAGETGQRLVAHPDVDMVSLTGSVETGKWIARAAADTLKRVHLELGGKAPVVVFDDADLEAVATGIAGAGYYNAGQDCTAATRVLVSDRMHDDVVEALAEQARGLAWGTPPTRDDARAAQLRPPAHERGRLHRAHARPRPARHRRPQPDSPGFFLEPTVVATFARTTSWPSARSSARSSPSSASATRRRRSSGPTARRTGSRRPCGRATSAAPCASRRRCGSAACGSTTTSRSSPRCRTAASSSPATARTFRCTGSRTTRSSSTSWQA